jgi:Cys-tRNA(Pro)/Cys-tRNA(Cys) deacylase
MRGGGTPAIDLLRRAGIDHRIHRYDPPERHGRERDQRPDYGHDAAASLGVDPARMFKTLIVTADGNLAAAIVPVDRQLDLRAVASILDARSAELVDPVVAARTAGSPVGGISPLGMRRALPTVVDASATGHPTVFVSAGRRGLQVELAPEALVRLSTAKIARIARSGP